jgi:hypothetical protein
MEKKKIVKKMHNNNNDKGLGGKKNNIPSYGRLTECSVIHSNHGLYYTKEG